MTAALGVVTLAVASLAAACSSGQSAAAGAGQASGSSGGASGGDTVSVRTIGGARVLVGPDGKTLYTNNQDRPGHPMCSSSDCHAIWTPLAVQGAQPSTGTTVTGTVGTVALPGGTRQVTYNGMPLYAFSFDRSAGTENGNSVHDSFGGTSFVWHAAMPQAQAPMQSSNGSAERQRMHKTQAQMQREQRHTHGADRPRMQRGDQPMTQGRERTQRGNDHMKSKEAAQQMRHSTTPEPMRHSTTPEPMM